LECCAGIRRCRDGATDHQCVSPSGERLGWRGHAPLIAARNTFRADPWTDDQQSSSKPTAQRSDLLRRSDDPVATRLPGALRKR
jgi:hypothetical protein